MKQKEPRMPWHVEGMHCCWGVESQSCTRRAPLACRKWSEHQSER
jgi:hypothetical protein